MLLEFRLQLADLLSELLELVLVPLERHGHLLRLQFLWLLLLRRLCLSGHRVLRVLLAVPRLMYSRTRYGTDQGVNHVAESCGYSDFESEGFSSFFVLAQLVKRQDSEDSKRQAQTRTDIPVRVRDSTVDSLWANQ